MTAAEFLAPPAHARTREAERLVLVDDGQAIAAILYAGAERVALVALDPLNALAIAGELIGAGAGAVAGGPGGAMAGTFVGRLLLDRLASHRLASPNALQVLRGALPPNPTGAQPVNAMQMLRALGQGAPVTAAPPIGYELAR